MSNKLLTALILVSLVVLMVGIIFAAAGGKRRTEESSASGEISYAQTENIIVPSVMPEQFQFQVPSGFTETASEAYNKYFVCRDASIIVTGEKLVITGEQLDHYVDGMLSQYQRTADQFELIKRENLLVDNIPCRILHFRYAIVAPDAKQDMESLTGVLIKDNKTYIVTCKSHAETFAGYMSLFREAIKSIRIADSASVPMTAATSQTFASQTQTTAEQTGISGTAAP